MKFLNNLFCPSSNALSLNASVRIQNKSKCLIGSLGDEGGMIALLPSESNFSQRFRCFSSNGDGSDSETARPGCRLQNETEGTTGRTVG